MGQRASWGSRLGFIAAVAGSAVGLANIWRFPYIVGQNGGAAFIAVYILCLAIIGFPVFMSEILVGRTTQTSPSGAFSKLGGSKWGWCGKVTIITGFLVSSFYSAVAGWILGYLIEAVKGQASAFNTALEVMEHHERLMNSPLWGLSFHFIFLLLCLGVLLCGVRKGIERGNKIMMPLLLALLMFLVVWGLLLPGAERGMAFLLTPDWSALTPTALLIALGQAFFTLSLGQGTMVTYGSYLTKKENLLASCIPVVLMDTVISLMAAIAVFTIVFSVGLEPSAGPGLIFQTLPWVFSQIPGGYGIAVMFFLLVMLAALTSEISALEPTIAYLMDEWGWKRKKAVIATGCGAFLVGIPSALSSSLLSQHTLGGMTFMDLMDFAATAYLIPFGGLCAVILVGWKWGMKNASQELKSGAEEFYANYPLVGKLLGSYFWLCIKFTAPLLITLVFLNSLGIFG